MCFAMAIVNNITITLFHLITWPVSMDPKDSIIMRLTCIMHYHTAGPIH